MKWQKQGYFNRSEGRGLRTLQLSFPFERYFSMKHQKLQDKIWKPQGYPMLPALEGISTVPLFYLVSEQRPFHMWDSQCNHDTEGTTNPRTLVRVTFKNAIMMCHFYEILPWFSYHSLLQKMTGLSVEHVWKIASNTWPTTDAATSNPPEPVS